MHRTRNAIVILKLIPQQSVHTFVEEQLLYPTFLKAVPSTQQVTERSVHDHAEAKEVINKILAYTDAQSTQFDKLVMELEKVINPSLFNTNFQDISSHVKDEEENILPQLANIVSSDVLLTLAKKIKEMKPNAPKRYKIHYVQLIF